MKEKEQYIAKIQQLIRPEMRENIKCGFEKSEIEYLERCRKLFISMQTGKPTALVRFFGNGKKEELQTLELWNELKPEVSRMLSGTLRSIKAQQMKSAINAVTAKSLIMCGMADAGLQFAFTAQRYRAKIEVKMSDTSKLVFYVNYKKAIEVLPTVIESAKIIKENIGKLGSGALINRICGWENWE